MWKRITSCLRRHRKKIIIVGGLIGGIALLNKYVKQKFVEWETNRTREYFEQLKRQHHFDGTIQTCDSAVLSLVSKIRDIVYSTIDVQPVVEALKSKPPNKLELWEELKILVFTQAIGEVYAQCLLVVLLRVQLSILGGYIYVETQKSKSLCSDVPSVFNTPDNQQKYLSHVHSFFENGIKELLKPIEEAVCSIFADVQLKDTLMLKDFSEILENVKLHISNGSPEVIPHIAQYVMSTEYKDPNQNEDTGYNQFLMKIISETKDVLECADFNKVLLSCVNHGIAVLMDRLSECYIHFSNNDVKFINPNNLAVPLAKIIPSMHSVVMQHEPTEQGSLVQELLKQDTLKCFAANVYEAFCQCPNHD